MGPRTGSNRPRVRLSVLYKRMQKTMSVDFPELMRFHLTGDKGAADWREAQEPGLRPALLGPYRDLPSLRHDYPLVLTDDGAEADFSQSLSSIVDSVLQEIAPHGASGERMRKHILRLESKIRALVACGEEGSLSLLWDLAARNLLSDVDEEAAGCLEESLKYARAALSVDGDLIDCDEETASKIMQRAWSAQHAEGARRSLEKIDKLELRLSEILEVDDLKASAAWAPSSLKVSMGKAGEDSIDFDALSGILKPSAHGERLPKSRRERILSALAVLESQRFFERSDDAPRSVDRPAPYPFVFASCARVKDVFKERIQEMVELVGAIAIAELEVDNHYDESEHDAFFAGLDETSLEPADLAFFPSYLVCLHDKECDGPEKAQLIDALSSGLPIKVMVQRDDILGETSLGDGRLALGVRSLQLASMAVGLGGAYVLQAASSDLHQLRNRIAEGMASSGPALFSIYSGSVQNVPDIPPYLTAACATQSRAFPSFSYDPDAGEGLALRLSMECNPQAEADWPIEELCYQDEKLQRVSEEVAFTFIDFAACDRRYARHFACVPRDSWCEDMVPVSQFLALDENEAREKVPFVQMIDGEDVLQRLLVDHELIRAARRCTEMWHNLQELGGHSAPHIAQEAEQQQVVSEPLEQSVTESSEQESSGDAKAAETDGAAAPELSPDEPYIETPRCTTCDECTQQNKRMFAYDENKQAYIVDPDAGSYRDLVMAAEACQVCIIHPGKPRDPNEPGLEDLIARAEPFN